MFNFIKNLFWKTSCENENVKYLCLFGRRYIYEEGMCKGWYRPNLNEVV